MKGIESIEWRGNTEICTSCSMTSGQWPFGRVRVSHGELEVRVLGRQLSIRAQDIVELRFFHRLLPCVVVICRTDDGFAMASFTTLRGERLRSLLDKHGFIITSEAKWYPMRQFSADVKKFGLYDDG